MGGRPRRRATKNFNEAIQKNIKRRERAEQRKKDIKAGKIQPRQGKPMVLSQKLQYFLGIDSCSRGDVGKLTYFIIVSTI